MRVHSSLISQQISFPSAGRTALNLRSFMGPVMLPVMAFVFSWLAAAMAVSEPMLFVSALQRGAWLRRASA